MKIQNNVLNVMQIVKHAMDPRVIIALLALMILIELLKAVYVQMVILK